MQNVKSENDTRNYILYNGNTAVTTEAASEEEIRLFEDCNVKLYA